MKKAFLLSLSLLILFGCTSWGGYQHKSSRFKFTYTFPSGWEVWDKSDDRRDFLLANYKGDPKMSIEVIATPVAPDLSTNEVYPFFLEGSGDAGELNEFTIEDKGLMPTKNTEGRFLRAKWKVDQTYMRSYRGLFLGSRFKLEVKAVMNEDQMNEHEAELTRMFHEIDL